MRFNARDREHIRRADCIASILYVDTTSTSMPYWIDRLAAEGLERQRSLMAQPVSLDGYDRRFRYYDGKPFWERGQEVSWDHPRGYIRRFINEEWWWYLNGQARVLDTPAL